MRMLYLIQDGTGLQHFGSVPSPEHLRRDLCKSTGCAHILWLSTQDADATCADLAPLLHRKFGKPRGPFRKFRADPDRIVRYLAWLRYVRPRYLRAGRTVRRMGRIAAYKAKLVLYNAKGALSAI